MLRDRGKPPAALLKLLRRLRQSLRRVTRRKYFSQRNKFIEEAKQVLPWLQASHLTLLAYEKHYTQPGRAGLPRHWELHGAPEPEQAQATEEWKIETLRRAVLGPEQDRPEYCIFRRSSKLPHRLYDLKKLNRFRPEPLWIERKIPKAGGKTWRTIHVPNAVLKQLLRFVLRSYLDDLPLDPAAHGFRKGSGRLEHAKHHAGKRLVIRLDIKDFFPSVTICRIVPVFQECGFCTRMARLLAHLVTHRGRLPQGAPTSPKLADLIARPLDRDLRALARRRGWYYSRYADDLCFSTKRELCRSDISRFISEVCRVVRKHRFKINGRKTAVMKGHNRQVVTGVVVNGAVPRAPRELRRKFRAVLHNLNQHGPLKAAEKYRDQVAKVWRQRSPHAPPLHVKPAREPWDFRRSDRLWPYDKQARRTPAFLRTAALKLRDTKWTELYDFWHFMCGLAGELISLEPHNRSKYLEQLHRARDAILHHLIAPTPEEKATKDLLAEIEELVKEVNEAGERFSGPLLEPFTVPNGLQRPTSSEEDALNFFGWLSKTWWKPRRTREMEKAGVYPYTMTRIDALKDWLYSRRVGIGLDDLKRQLVADLLREAGTQTPEGNDWAKLEIHILEKLLEDLRSVSQWARRRPGRKGSIDPHDCESLRALLKRGEGQNVEFKRGGTSARDVAKEITAFLNTSGGGWIIYGVTDDGTILGVEETRDEFEQKVQNCARDRIYPTPGPLEIREIQCDEGTVFVIPTPPFSGQPSFFKKDDGRYRVLVRAGAVTREANPDEQNKLFRGQPCG